MNLFLEQVILVMCKHEKCYFILMQSANFDEFQLIVLALIQIACWLFESGGFREGGSVVVCEGGT
jgi:hypothetical protein